MKEEVLRLERVSCAEQGIKYLEDFNLQIFAGEIMGLLAINRSGLDTLVRLLCSNIPVQRGYVYYRERCVNSWHARMTEPAKIRIIGSRSSLVAGLTVADNVFVLRPGFKSWLIRPALLRTQLELELESLGIAISPDEYVEKLSHFHQIVVELLKAVIGGCHLVILREVSTFISSADMQSFREIIRKFADRGISFLYIGYHYEELVKVCDRTALLINGSILKVLRKGEFPDFFSEHYQRMLRSHAGSIEERETRGEPVLEVRHLTGGKVRDLTFTACAGECVVLQDLNNQIFRDLLALLSGHAPVEAGECLMSGQPFTPGYTRDIAFIMENPSNTMLLTKLSVLDNLCFNLDHRLPAVWRSRRLRWGIVMELSQVLDPSLFQLRTEELSVGQKYDVIYGRIWLQHPKVVFCVQPFQGADLDLRKRIWDHLEKLMEEGCAVVILAVNLADTLSLAHQLIRIESSRENAYYEREEFSALSDDTPWQSLFRRNRHERQKTKETSDTER